jgi:hypothetical protein
MIKNPISLLYLSDFCTTLLLQDKLLSKLEENEPELATSQEDEVIFISLKLRIQHE